MQAWTLAVLQPRPLNFKTGRGEAAQNSPQSVTAAGTPTSPLEEDEECEVGAGPDEGK